MSFFAFQCGSTESTCPVLYIAACDVERVECLDMGYEIHAGLSQQFQVTQTQIAQGGASEKNSSLK